MLRRFFSIKDQPENKAIKNSLVAKQIYDELYGLYNKVPVSMKKPDFCVSKICKLYDKWRSIKKTPKTCSKATIENFQNELNKMCDLVGKD